MRIVLLIAIVIFAAIAGLGVMWLSGGVPSLPTSAPNTAPMVTAGGEVATVDILVARDDISLGTQLSEKNIDRQPWPRHLVLEGFIVDDSPQADVIGMVARADFKAREPLILSKLTQADDASYLASSLPKGARAITVAVDAVSGLAGYLLPGDRVDILFTHGGSGGVVMPGENIRGAGAAISEVFMSNIKVLAVNTRELAGGRRNDSDPYNVTLQMGLNQAKRIRLAEKNGTLSLILRSLGDTSDATQSGAITTDTFASMEQKERKEEKYVPYVAGDNDEVIIIRGVVEESSGDNGGGMKNILQGNPLGGALF